MESDLIQDIHKLGVIPVLQIDNEDCAVPVAEALSTGGLPIAEITLRTKAALASIRNITRTLPHILVGAGTILDKKQAEEACEAGAKFLVSPGLADDVITWAQQKNIPIIAGAVTPTEIMRAIQLGLTLLKFFPSEAMGGLKTIKSVSEPFPQVRFIPTGGIQLENLAEYLCLDKVHAVGGSWMATQQAIHEARFDDIARLAKKASETIRQIRG